MNPKSEMPLRARALFTCIPFALGTVAACIGGANVPREPVRTPAPVFGDEQYLALNDDHGDSAGFGGRGIRSGCSAITPAS